MFKLNFDIKSGVLYKDKDVNIAKSLLKKINDG